MAIRIQYFPSPQPAVALLARGLAIVLALVEFGVKISDLEDAVLTKNLDWVVERPWLDERLRPVFERGLGRLRAPRGDEAT